VQAVRDNPPPFWAMESLLKEYPISSAEGLGLMRLAEALLRVPDAETAIALTADQLGRADFDGSGDKVLSRLSSTAIAMSKHFLPDPQTSGPKAEPGLMAKLGAAHRGGRHAARRAAAGAPVCAGPDHEAEASTRRRCSAQEDAAGCASATTCWARARAPMPMPALPAELPDAIESIAAVDSTGLCEQNDGISIKLSALHPRFEDAQWSASWPSWCPACGACASRRRGQHQPDH
jgi:RHH-type proline utilization regulon transcriptional repressor/proline dehydrogenase/delta 1-pyrroline-5-carboxylate dehydrogenase